MPANPRGRFLAGIYGVTRKGNFEGKNIPNLLGGSLAAQADSLGQDEIDLASRLQPSLRKLLEARETRARPATDDKVLTAWNGLMLTAFARAYQILGRHDDLVAAERAAAFLESKLIRDKRLLVSFRDGQARLNAYLDDYAFLAPSGPPVPERQGFGRPVHRFETQVGGTGQEQGRGPALPGGLRRVSI